MKKVLFFGAALMALLVFLPFSAVRADEIEVNNPSFEITNPNGSAQKWNGDVKYFSVEYGSGRTGNAALCWLSSEPEVYKLCSQSVPVKPGSPVEFSAWIKTEDVQGGRAAVCMEWSGNGKYLGGCYARGVNGTNAEWQKVLSRTTVPENASSVSITCYVTKGGTGTAWFDDIEIKTWTPPLFSGVNTDHYRHITDGSDLTVRVGVSKAGFKAELASVTDPLVVTGESLAEPIKIAPSACGDDYLEFVVPTKELAPGKYTATLEMKHPVDGSTAKIERSFTRVEQYPKRKTYIDEFRRTIVDGEPFFPLGCYFGDVKPGELDIYADSAFNCLMPYHPISRDTLDLCASKNIRVIYSVKDNFPDLAVKTAEEGIENTKAKVAEMKDHPAIFAWYINDELPLSMLDELTARRDLMEELDPERPAWVVLYQLSEVRSYIPTFDVIGTDPYPIPGPASRAADYSRQTNDAVFNMQAVWQVPQIFNWAAYKKTEEEKKFNRAPTYEEMRAMAWMGIAGGANGLVFYSWFDLLRMDKTVAEGGQALVREPFDERWPQVKKMAAEIAEYIPVLLAVEPTLDVSLDRKSTGDDVMLRLYGYEGKTWALLVNTSNEPRTAVLSTKAAKSAELKLGGKIASQNDESLSIELAPLEPCFVLLHE